MQCASASGHGRWTWLRWPTRRCYLWRSWTMTNDSKHIQASFLLTQTDWIHLRVAQMPRSRDPAIFMLTTDGQTDWLFYPCACTWSNYFKPIRLIQSWVGDHITQRSELNTWCCTLDINSVGMLIKIICSIVLPSSSLMWTRYMNSPTSITQWSPSIGVSAGWTAFHILYEIFGKGQMSIPKIKDQQ